MSLSSSLDKLRRFGAEPDLSDRVAQLSHDVARLARSMGKSTRPMLEDAGHSASEFADDVVHQLAPVARQIGERAQAAGRSIRRDPVPAVIAVGTVALIAALLMSRR